MLNLFWANGAMIFNVLIHFSKNMGKDKHFKPKSITVFFRHCFIKFSPKNVAAQCVTKTHTWSYCMDFYQFISHLSNEKWKSYQNWSSGSQVMSFLSYQQFRDLLKICIEWAILSLEIATLGCENAQYDILRVKDMICLVFGGSYIALGTLE